MFFHGPQVRLGKDCCTNKAASELRKGDKKTTSNSDTTISNVSLATADAVATVDDVVPYSFD